MKVLSLLQPWASLVVLGYKKIETRSFQRSYRGPLLIHASKDKHGYKSIDSGPFKQYFMPALWGDVPLKERQPLPFGAIIGKVNLICIRDTNSIRMTRTVLPHYYDDRGNLHHIPFTDQEEAFGDYSPGRYGWLLSDPVMFNDPIPAKGMLGLWEYDGPLPTFE